MLPVVLGVVTGDLIDIQEENMADVKIEIRANGPSRVYGPIEIVDQDGNNYTLPEGQWVTLCRCGQSVNKPYCDGTHREAGFEAPSKAS
jgi:CDGSH-type Zn-finger protein